MWDLPRPGLEPMSPALAGRFSTTAPPGKPRKATVLISLCGKPFISKFSHGTNIRTPSGGKRGEGGGGWWWWDELGDWD